MSATTGISWSNHTGGPWLLCTEVSPGCAHCYARELMLARLAPLVRKAYKAAGFHDWETRAVWGKTAPRVLTKGFWKEARSLNAKAEKDGVRRRMFPSMIDWLDDCPAGIIDQGGTWLDIADVRQDFLQLIIETPQLDWLLLTKRPERFREFITSAFGARSGKRDVGLIECIKLWVSGAPPANVWIGISVEDQIRADQRIPHLLNIPARVRFLSVEPQLGPVDLTLVSRNDGWKIDCLSGIYSRHCNEGFDHPSAHEEHGGGPSVSWVICGGESGTDFRPFEVAWAESLAAQCAAAGIPFFMKQDSGFRSGHQGRLPDALWNTKEYPTPTAMICGVIAAYSQEEHE